MKKKERIWVPHIVKEGARYHVISYHADRGIVCSEPNCEENKPHDKPREAIRRKLYEDPGDVDDGEFDFWAGVEAWDSEW